MKQTRVFAAVLAWGVTLAVSFAASAQQQPRELSEQEIAKLHQGVKKSKARSEAQVRADAVRAQELEEQTRRELAQMDEDARLLKERLAADDAEREAEARALREDFAAKREKSERDLAESIANARASAARDNAMMAESRRRAQQGTGGQGSDGPGGGTDVNVGSEGTALEIEAMERTSVPPATAATPPPPAQPSPTGPRMGFPGPTCERARLGAQQWVGSGGTFEIESETTGQDGWCHIVIRDWHSGKGTASSQ